MPFTFLDFILLGIMLISGLLALARGFTREVLSLVAWGAAAVAAYFAIKQPDFVEFAKTNIPYLDKEILAQIAVGATAFLFYGWLLPLDKQQAWVRNAYSLPMIKSAGEGLLSFMPPDIAETLSNTALADKPGAAEPPKLPDLPEAGYQSNENQGLENLIQGTGGAEQPATGQGNSQ